MIEGYALYLKVIKNKSPMSEEQWKQAIGIKDEVEVHIPLTIIPKKDSRPIRATFDNHLLKG